MRLADLLWLVLDPLAFVRYALLRRVGRKR